MKYQTNSDLQTKELAKKIAGEFDGGVIGLVGELGAGKTTFVQGFAQGLQIKDKVISPTFVLMRQHPIPKTNGTLFHLDLYRLDQPDTKQLGLNEMLDNPKNIILIEWAEKISNNLPLSTLWIRIKKTSPIDREITVQEEKVSE